jgi:hypothetical protein
MSSTDPVDDNPWGQPPAASSTVEDGHSGSGIGHEEPPPGVKAWPGRSVEFSVSRGMPYKSTSGRPMPSQCEKYEEPDISIASTSYPPPAPSPFVASRSIGEPSKPLSTKGSSLDDHREHGPLSYAWNPKEKGGRVVLGIAVVDFNHLVSNMP